MKTKNDFLLRNLYSLFDSKCFDDFTFNCKDGKVTANRLILAVYSDFLKQVFESNPNIVKHPLLEGKEFGINLPEVTINDVQKLLRVVYASGSTKLLVSDFIKVQNVAKLLHISLKTSEKNRGYVTISPIPDGFNESECNVQPVKHEHIAANCNGDIDNENDSFSVSDSTDNINGTDDVDDENYSNCEELDSIEASQTSIVCEICNITCKSWRGLKSHFGHVHKTNDINRSLNQPKIVCKCGLTFAFKSRQLWKQHKQKCAAFKREGFICELCDMAFDSYFAMKTHKHSVHGVSVKARTCVCGETFATKHAYRKHQNNCQMLRSAALICDDCEMPFISKGGLMQHLNATGHRCRKIEETESFRFFNAIDSKDESERKICKCGLTFAKNSRHLFREHRAKCVAFMAEAFVCDVCGAPFPDTFSLNTHKFKAHGILTGANKCVCGEKFRTSYSYRKHRVDCDSYKEIAVFCQECNTPFASERHLQFHLESGVHSELSIGD